MNNERDLNEVLGSESVVEAPAGQEIAMAAAPEVAPEAAPAAAATDESTNWESLKDYISRNNNKLENAAIVDVSGFTRVPQGKFMLFCTIEQEDADLVLLERPNTLWIDRSIVPDSIKVESSGVIIKTNNSRIYVGKNNVTKFDINDTRVTSMSTIGRAKTASEVTIDTEQVAVSDKPVEEVKLHIKKISPRLYNQIKDCTTKAEIKGHVVTFMNKVYDLNHLIKIEKELLLSLSL